MPTCQWSEEECDKLEQDLVTRLEAAHPKNAAGGSEAGGSGGGEKEKKEEKKEEKEEASAPAPAAAFVQIIPHPVASGVFGWCDTVWTMSHQKHMDAVAEEHIPAKAKKPDDKDKEKAAGPAAAEKK